MFGFLIALTALVAGSLGTLLWGMRHPERLARVYDRPPWRRIHNCTLAVTGALLLGAWPGGAPENTLLAVAVIGLIVGSIPSRFVASERGNRWRGRE